MIIIIIIIIIVQLLLIRITIVETYFPAPSSGFTGRKKTKLKKKKTNEKKIDQWQRAGLAHRNTD